MSSLNKIIRWALRLWIGAALTLGIFVLGFFFWVARASDCCTLSEPQPAVQKTFQVSGAPELEVRNVTGSIHVIGDGKSEIRLTAGETVRGNSSDDIERAKREVRVNIIQKGNRIVACIQQPSFLGFSSGTGDCENAHIQIGDSPYRVRFDFEIHVPTATKVNLNTVNEGDIRVEDVSGGFEVRNVNGRVDLEAVSGAGEAATVNGEVKAMFAANPVADCGFSTVNGSVHLYFRPDLAARLRYATVNGDVYTDFPVITEGKDKSSPIVFRSGRVGNGQIGSGGPRIQINTVNGGIFVHRS